MLHHLIRKLWRDDDGAMLATEWVFMGTILILGIIPGMVAFRNALNTTLLKSACAPELQQLCVQWRQCKYPG